jgi:hypothetical protein
MFTGSEVEACTGVRAARRLWWVAALCSCMLLRAAVVRAQEPAQPGPDLGFAAEADSGSAPHSPLATVASFAAGALSGFLLHEAGHVAANLMLGNTPRFQGMLVWGFVPFFVLSPDIRCMGDDCQTRNGKHFTPGTRGDVYIVSAGFSVQHLTDEFILGATPELANEYAPFRKGLLGFNILLSVMYAAGAYAGIEDQHGDVHGMARRLEISDRWVATMLLLPAALDAYRYFFPYSSWAVWASRIVKASMFGVTFVF